MKIWSKEEEAAQLASKFAGVKRASFAREFEVPGGDALIYQHIRGLRPISRESAMAYAKGFNCSLEEISPRLAKEAKDTAALSSDGTQPPIATPAPTDPTLAYLDALPPAISARLRLDIKHAHERWELEQETSAHNHHRADDPPEKLPKARHSG